MNKAPERKVRALFVLWGHISPAEGAKGTRQTTTRYAGAHRRLYPKTPQAGTMMLFKPHCKQKGEFYGK